MAETKHKIPIWYLLAFYLLGMVTAWHLTAPNWKLVVDAFFLAYWINVFRQYERVGPLVSGELKGE